MKNFVLWLYFYFLLKLFFFSLYFYYTRVIFWQYYKVYSEKSQLSIFYLYFTLTDFLKKV